METSLPLFCEEDEEACRDVNNSLPPVAERGMDHEGMSHAVRGGRGQRRIRTRSFLSPGGVVSFLLRQRVVVQQAVGSCLACVRVEAFRSFLLLQRSCSVSFGFCLAQ